MAAVKQHALGGNRPVHTACLLVFTFCDQTINMTHLGRVGKVPVCNRNLHCLSVQAVRKQQMLSTYPV